MLEADYLIVSMGAELAPESVPGLADAGHSFYTLPGAESLHATKCISVVKPFSRRTRSPRTSRAFFSARRPAGTAPPERDIRAIHQASVANLREAIRIFGRVRVFDSTARWAPPRLVAVARSGRVAKHGATPGWPDFALMDHDD